MRQLELMNNNIIKITPIWIYIIVGLILILIKIKNKYVMKEDNKYLLSSISSISLPMEIRGGLVDNSKSYSTTGFKKQYIIMIILICITVINLNSAIQCEDGSTAVRIPIDNTIWQILWEKKEFFIIGSLFSYSLTGLILDRNNKNSFIINVILFIVSGIITIILYMEPYKLSDEKELFKKIIEGDKEFYLYVTGGVFGLSLKYLATHKMPIPAKLGVATLSSMTAGFTLTGSHKMIKSQNMFYYGKYIDKDNNGGSGKSLFKESSLLKENELLKGKIENLKETLDKFKELNVNSKFEGVILRSPNENVEEYKRIYMDYIDNLTSSPLEEILNYMVIIQMLLIYFMLVIIFNLILNNIVENNIEILNKDKYKKYKEKILYLYNKNKKFKKYVFIVWSVMIVLMSMVILHGLVIIYDQLDWFIELHNKVKNK